MKKVLTIFLLIGLILGGVVWVAHAATSDTFNITITVAYISIELKDRAGNDYTTWAIGTVNQGAVSTMDANGGDPGDKGILVSNESNVAIDLACWATNTLNWTLGSTPGENQCVLRARGFDNWQSGPYPNMDGATTITATSSPGNTVDSNITNGDDRYWYYDLTAPTSVTSGAQNTFTVTINAFAH